MQPQILSRGDLLGHPAESFKPGPHLRQPAGLHPDQSAVVGLFSAMRLIIATWSACPFPAEVSPCPGTDPDCPGEGAHPLAELPDVFVGGPDEFGRAVCLRCDGKQAKFLVCHLSEEPHPF